MKAFNCMKDIMGITSNIIKYEPNLKRIHDEHTIIEMDLVNFLHTSSTTQSPSRTSIETI